MIINKFFDYINEKGPFIFQTPWVGTIGNCAEEIYYGLLRARREGKKVVFLFPYNLFWKLKFSSSFINRELLKIQSDYRYEPLWENIGNLCLTLIYACMRIPIIFLRKFFQLKVPGTYLVPDIGQSSLWKPVNVNYFSWEIAQTFQWDEQINKYLPVRMNRNSYEKARKIRVDMGIPENEWFACLHVREGGFYNDYEEVPCRNASIRNYIKGIEAITCRGGWVVRMGDTTMTPLPTIEHVVDYPHTQFKSDLMDIYLVSECRFFIGSQSGMAEVAALFQKPMLIPNMFSWTVTAYPPRKGDLGIIKHIYSRSRKRFLSLQEILEEPFECQYFGPLGKDYIMYENTPQEINDLIVEYLEYIENPENYRYSQLQLEFNRRRIIQGNKITVNQMIHKDYFSDVHDKYRIASRVYINSGALEKKYLEQNWEQDIMNKRDEYKNKHPDPNESEV